MDVLGRRLPIDNDLPTQSEVDVLLRPEAVGLTAAEGSGAIVVAAAFLGATTRLTVRLPDGTEVRADLSPHVAATLALGTNVTLTVPDRAVLVAARAA